MSVRTGNSISKQVKVSTPLLLERGISLKIELPSPQQEVAKRDKLREAAQSAMDKAVEKAGNVQFTGLSTMRRNFEERKEQMEVIEA